MTHTTSGRYTRHVGRVGALAFALGVGVAVTNSPAVAAADTGNSGSNPSAHSAPHAAASQSVTATKRTGTAAPRPSTQARTNPLIPRDAATLTDVLGYARREAEATTQQPAATIGNILFARTPTMGYNAAQNVEADDGTITGTLNAKQANGYALTYTVTSAPQHGTVVINADGTFTYTPDAQFTTLGGTDTFTVVADDQPGNQIHWHGLATFFAPNGGSTATATVTVLENPGAAAPTSVLSTTDQLDGEQTATQLANSPFVQLAKVVLKVGWWLAAQKNFAMIGGPDQENMAQLDQAVTEYANQAAMEVLLLNSNAPNIFQQVAPTHSWYLQTFAGSRIWYDNPDTIYRFVGVNTASSYVITGKFDGTLPADTNFSVLTGLSGTTADNLNGKDLVLNPDGSFTITVDSTPTAPGQSNHLYLPPGATLITTRNTLSDWNTQEPMSLSILRVSGPPDSLFSQLGGFAIPGIGPLVSGNPLLTSLVSVIPPLPAPRLLQSIETAVIMLLLGISGEDKYMSVATKDATTGQTKAPNVLSNPAHNASFLATQLQSVGYFQLADNQALVITINPEMAGYFSVPVTNDWTITNNYWDEQTSLNISQSDINADGETYTIVVSPTDPGVANWVSTGGLNQGTISIRFQDFDPDSDVDPTVSSQVVNLSDLATVLPAGTVYVTPDERAAQIANRQVGYNNRYAPYPQA
ncbi:cadherin-like domain-containing protein [Mycolicibacterium sphagni]|uniref:cadherin-like domain-containing protein n=1 Tax=Mycolicibacterium sphagni TaxID=1786 RepID=UPI0021F3232D|nr:cadherin-like domain-containing protein [Mycolicibacterium sphagni]